MRALINGRIFFSFKAERSYFVNMIVHDDNKELKLFCHNSLIFIVFYSITRQYRNHIKSVLGFALDRVSTGMATTKTGSSHTSRSVRRTKSGHNFEESSYEESSSSSTVRRSKRSELTEEVSTSRSSRKTSEALFL